MNDVFQLVRSHVIGVWRRRWYVLAVAWVICGGGWAAVASLPDRYETSARIYVDVDTMLGPLMRGIAVEMNLFQQIDIMRRTLLSRPNLEKIILMTDLDLTVKKEEEKEKLVEKLRSTIDVKQQGRNLFEISYNDTDRALTKRVVQAVMQIFVEGNLGASRKDMDTTRRFLEDQIRSYERQLIESEQRLAKFKRENLGMLPGGHNNYYDYMQDVRKRLAQTEGAIGEATMVRDELHAQLEEVPQFLELAGDSSALGMADGTGPGADIQMRIIELEQVLDSLLTRYTDKHPDVVSTQKRLDDLKKQQEEEFAAEAAMLDGQSADPEAGAGPDAAGPRKNLVPNPVYEQVKLQLVQQEGMIAALKTRAEQARKEVEKWSGMAKLVPQVEAELSRLNRDYDIVKKGYEELRRRQESAKLARDLETKAQKVQFRIIDPPKLPLEPVGPNRILFHSVILLVGIAGGIVCSFLLSQIASTFSTVQRLRATFTLPVLGRVSAIISARERRRRIRELVSFGMVFATLLVAFSGLLTIELLGSGTFMTAVKQLITL